MADLFDQFWTAYPRKVGKGAARPKFQRALKKLPFEQLMAALRAFKWPDDPKFIPHPATWLHQERWADEEPPSPTHLNAVPTVSSDISAWVPKIKSRSPFACQWVANHYAHEARQAYRDGILDDTDMHTLGLRI